MDRDWYLERSRYMVPRSDNEGWVPPNLAGDLVAGLVLTAMLASALAGLRQPPPWLVLAVGVVVGLCFFRRFKNAVEYIRACNAYQQRRTELLQQLESGVQSQSERAK